MKTSADPSENIDGTTLPKRFYERPSPMVAFDLLGKVLQHRPNGAMMAGMIVETEAYLGKQDLACHASSGRTERTRLFYEDEPAGIVYMFSIYGLYNCMNVLTSGENPAGCVLIRALEPLLGIKTMMKNRSTEGVKNLTNGPGRLTNALAISNRYNGHLITEQPLIIQDCGFDCSTPDVGPRIGISKAKEYPLRFFLRDSPFAAGSSRKLLTRD